MVGILFIIATLAPILSGIFLVPIQNATDLLSHVATHEYQLILGVILELVMILAIVTIPVLLLPVLKKHNETFPLYLPPSLLKQGGRLLERLEAD